MRTLFAIFLSSYALFGGQSVSLTGGGFLFVVLPTSTTARPEFSLHNWSSATSGTVYDSQSNGWRINFGVSGGVQVLTVDNRWDTSGGAAVNIPIGDTALFPVKELRIRMQHTSSYESIEAVNFAGVAVIPSTQATPTSTPGSNSFDFISASDIEWGFHRVHTTIVPVGTPITTVNTTARLVENKFDGDLLDASGNGYTASVSAGTPTFPSSNTYQNVVGMLRTANAPSWASVVSQRAGRMFQLDGSGSYSMGDSSATVTCFWQQLSGPSQVVWDSHTSCTPSVSGTIFGDYLFQLITIAADGTGLTSTTSVNSAHVGVAATDSKGVIVQANSAADVILGPMMLFGANPWPWYEERAYCGLLLKAKEGLITEAPGCAGEVGGYDVEEGFPASGPVWSHTGQGNVDYTYSPTYGGNMATTTSAIDPSSLSFTVNSTTNLDISTMPIVVGLGDPFADAVEYAWVCDVTGLTATFCYDGRHNAGTWASGKPVNMNKVTGHGTLFLSDPLTTICAGGAPQSATSPGVPSGHTIASGTVTVAHGATSLIWASGSAWAATLLTPGGGLSNFIVVDGKHGGVDFKWYSDLATFTNSTRMDATRAYPATADDGTYSYTIESIVSMSPYVTRVGQSSTYYGNGGPQVQTTQGCASETSAFISPVHDGGALNNFSFTAQPYTYMEGTWSSGRGQGDPQFYGEYLGHLAMWLRSGLDLAKDAGRRVVQWASIPSYDFGRLGSQAYNTGGGAVSALTCVAVDPGCPYHWTDVRATGNAGVAGSYPCDSTDSRSLGYGIQMTAIPALFDPTPPTSTYWTDKVTSMYSSDNSCKTPPNLSSAPWANSWAVTQPYMSTVQQPVNFTNGSANATFTGAQFCFATASGTATVTNGSGTMTIATGTLPTPSLGTEELTITGTKSGSPYWLFLGYTGGGTTGAVITLSGLWDGATGTINWQYTPDGHLTTIGAQSGGVIDTADPQWGKDWSCLYNSGTHVITLNSPWDGPSNCGANGCGMAYNGLPGVGPGGTMQQPFMLTMRAKGYDLLSHLLGSLGTNYQTLTNTAATWQHDYGYEPVSQGFYYFRGAGCEPVATPTPGTTFANTQSGCNTGLDLAGIMAARELTAENMKLVGSFYRLNPSQTNKDYGDKLYGSLYGNPSFTNTGYTTATYDAGRLSLSNASIGGHIDSTTGNRVAAFKWFGFHFGVGMNHQWPAVRLGGVAPDTDRRTVKIPFRLANISTAAEVSIVVTEPNSIVHSPVICTSSPCAVTVDGRQGSHLYRLTYQNSSHVALSSTDIAPLYVQ